MDKLLLNLLKKVFLGVLFGTVRRYMFFIFSCWYSLKEVIFGHDAPRKLQVRHPSTHSLHPFTPHSFTLFIHSLTLFIHTSNIHSETQTCYWIGHRCCFLFLLLLLVAELYSLGCCYGGELTAYILPNRELVSVPAHKAYAAKNGPP